MLLLTASMLISGVQPEELPCGPTVRTLEVTVGSTGTLTIPTSAPFSGHCRAAKKVKLTTPLDFVTLSSTPDYSATDRTLTISPT